MDTDQHAPFAARLLRLHREAWDAGRHAVAYHALAAAAHDYDDGGDESGLAQVERLARAHLAWIDEHQPEHRLSEEASRGRGHSSIFQQLALTTSGMRIRARSDRQLREARGRHA